MSSTSRKIWITWEEQRRTEELARRLGVPLHKVIYKGHYLAKVLYNSFSTLRLLLRERPGKLIIQNPSMSLAALACFLKPAGFRLVVDRHSNFKFHTAGSASLKFRIFHLLSRYTVKKADLTIVTNEFLKKIVEDWGGRGFVLQDAIPSMPLKGTVSLKGRFNIIYPCSFDSDEPVKEVLSAAALLPKDIFIYVTGNSAKLDAGIRRVAPENIVFTGFLSEKEYQSLLNSSDLVYALTTQDYTLLCCAYEAVALGKPMVLSEKLGLKEYFRKGAVLTDNTPGGIAAATLDARGKYEKLQEDVKGLFLELECDWNQRFADLKAQIEAL